MHSVKTKALSAGLAAVMALAPVAARATEATSFQNMPVTGTAADGSTFAGTFTVDHFQAVGKQQLLAVGTLTGTFTSTTGVVTPLPATSVAWPVEQIDGKPIAPAAANSPQGGFGGSQTGALSPRLDTRPAAFHPESLPGAGIVLAQRTCSILDLTLGPLHLDLLGLVVDLNQVHLTITAEQGSGNLLGNLLCAITNLLNGGGPIGNLLQGIANLLNQILGALGGL